jgi:hypothetical protein
MSFFYLHNNLPCHQCTFIHQSVFERVGYYDESLKIVADWNYLFGYIKTQRHTYRKVDAVFYFSMEDKFVARKSIIIENERAQVLQIRVSSAYE